MSCSLKMPQMSCCASIIAPSRCLILLQNTLLPHLHLSKLPTQKLYVLVQVALVAGDTLNVLSTEHELSPLLTSPLHPTLSSSSAGGTCQAASSVLCAFSPSSTCCAVLCPSYQAGQHSTGTVGAGQEAHRLLQIFPVLDVPLHLQLPPEVTPRAVRVMINQSMAQPLRGDENENQVRISWTLKTVLKKALVAKLRQTSGNHLAGMLTAVAIGAPVQIKGAKQRHAHF